MSKFCAFCGARLTEDALFCYNCGRTVVKAPGEEDQPGSWSMRNEKDTDAELKTYQKTRFEQDEREVDLFDEDVRTDESWRSGETTWLDEQQTRDEADRTNFYHPEEAEADDRDDGGTRRYTPLDQEETRIYDPRYDDVDEFQTQEYDPREATRYIPDEPKMEEEEEKHVQRQSSSKSNGSGKKLEKKTIIILACCGGLVVLLIILLIVMMSCGNNTAAIDLNDYVTVTFSGSDGYGTAEAAFDEENFIIDHADDFNNNVYGSGTTDVTYFAEEYQTYIVLSQTDSLSNGDTVILSWDCDADAVLEIYGVTVTCDAKTLTVSGLSEAGTCDAFDSVTVTFTGSDGYGECTLTQAENDYASIFTFSADQTEGLSNGDTVTVTCTMSITESEFVETYGLTIGELTKTYTVSDLSEAGTLDPFDVAEVTFEGTDGYGTVSITVTDESYGFSFAADVKSELSNGDKVTVTCTLSMTEEEFIKTYGVVPGDLTKEYEVSGLSDLTTFDPFDYIDVSYSGVSGEGIATITVSSSAPDVMDQYYPTESTISGLSNGDTITVELLCHSTESEIAQTYAMTPSSTSKTYTVSGLDAVKYVSGISDITSDELTTLRNETVYEIEDQVSGLSSTTYLGLYVLSAYSSSAATQNRIYVLYEVTVSYEVEDDEGNTSTETFTYVTGLEVKNLYTEEGSFYYDESALVQKTVSNNGTTYNGFASVSDFEEWVTNKYSSSFEMEDNL